jgi:hypothetical protein
MKEFYRKDADKVTEEARVKMYGDVLEKLFDEIRKEAEAGRTSYKATFLNEFTWSAQNDIIDLIHNTYEYVVNRDANNIIIIKWF